HVLQATAHMEKAIRVNLAKIPGAYFATQFRAPQVTCHDRAGDADFAILIDPYPCMRQRPSDTIGSVASRRVEAHNGSALAQSVTLEHRQTGRTCLLKQLQGDGAAANRDEFERRRNAPAA